jgi:lysophospholipase L1-like esterase
MKVAKDRLVNWSVLIGTCVACLLVAELGLRALSPVAGYLVVTYRQTIPGVKETVVFERDHLGLRSKPQLLADTVSPIRILCLGASTTEQATQSFHDTWCGNLGEKLNLEMADAGFEPSFETMIFGRGGWRAVDVLAWAELNIEAVGPDVVVLLLGVNDLTWNSSSVFSAEGLGAAVAASREWQTLKPFLTRCRRASRICQQGVDLLTHIRGRYRVLTGRSLEWHSAMLTDLRAQRARLPLISEFDRNPDPIAEFREATDSLISLLRGRGIGVIVLGQPVLWREGLSEEEEATLWFSIPTPSGRYKAPAAVLRAEMDRFNQVQESLAAQHDIIYLDLGAILPRTLDVFFDDCHFTDLGNLLVSRAVLPVVSDLVRSTRHGSAPL